MLLMHLLYKTMIEAWKDDHRSLVLTVKHTRVNLWLAYSLQAVIDGTIEKNPCRHRLVAGNTSVKETWQVWHHRSTPC